MSGVAPPGCSQSTGPSRRNAVDPATADQLLEAYREFESDDEALVLILTGAGRGGLLRGSRSQVGGRPRWTTRASPSSG